MDNRHLVLLLGWTRGVGPRTMEDILRRNALYRRRPEDLLGLPVRRLADDYALTQAVAGRLYEVARTLRTRAEQAVRELDRAGVHIVTIQDATYPARLQRTLADPPPALFAFGNLGLLDRPLFAVANSNDVPESALAIGDQAAEAAMNKGWTLVTGHNRIAYQRTALVAARRQMPCIFVLDRGLVEGFGGDLERNLFSAARIWRPNFDPASDLAVSALSTNAHGTSANNRRRDKLIFALASLVIAVDVRPEGNMARACAAAEERGAIMLDGHTAANEGVPTA